MPTAGAPRIVPDRPSPERPAPASLHSDGPADFGAGILPPGGHERTRGDDMVPDAYAYEASEPPRAAPHFEPPRAEAVIIPATRADGAGDRFEPRIGGTGGPRKEAPRIDLTPETAPGSGGGGGAEPPLTLAVVPQRGDGSLVVYRRRPRRRLLLWSGIALIVLIVAVGLGWRMAAGPRGAAPIAVVEAGRDWAPLVADPATLGPGPRIVSATGPFRLRVDGTVYTILDSQPVTIPLEKAKSVEVKAIDGTAKVTITKP
ncbi:hypothetical protein [Segnochrobactrum spirostomi]|uniref:Uncharacterized protein n=1 Tax=Segnochrobactrum spirostomi TaxID=2608987 RepID=A0A6A7Y3V5_9HYPH|nr:hypothetical protein [Segnochrobactrum spirostomi]MQT13405.1 hypothetical protein [Segnochrobactrum spirostomi]